MDLGQGLKVELSAITGLTGKVSPIEAAQGTIAPYLTFSLGDKSRTMTLEGYDGLVQSQFQLDIYHSTYPGLLSLKELVIQNIKTYAFRAIGGSGPYIQQTEIIKESESYESAVRLWRGFIEINIDYRE